MVWWLCVGLLAGYLRDAVLGGIVFFSAGVGTRTARRLGMPLLVVACGLWVGVSQRASEQRQSSADLILREHRSVCGRVVGFPSTSPWGCSVEVALIHPATAGTIRVLLPRFDISPGDTLNIDGRWQSPRDGWPGRFRARQVQIRGGRKSSAIFWHLRTSIRETLSRRLGTNAPLVLALVLGERGHLGTARRNLFVQLGISHLFALSGMHLGLIATVLAATARRRSRARDVALATTLLVYVCTVGRIDSLIRALAMVLLATAARLLGRPLRAIDALAAAFVVMVLYDPTVLRSIGFQLSFAATAAVLITVPHIGPDARTWRRVGIWGRVPLTAATGVTMGVWVNLIVAPLQLFHFDVISPVGPLATVLCTPVVAALLVGGFIAAAIAPVPVVGVLVGDALGAFAGASDSALRFAASIAPDPVALPVPLLPVLVGGVSMALPRRNWRWRMAGWALIAVSFAVRAGA